MRKVFLAIVLLISTVSIAQKIELSPSSKISIITLGPDNNELYAAFGHSAIRVYDSLQGIDYAYNYGVFDFDQPNFYLNFARGFLYYKLGVYSYQDFKNAYIYYNRFIHEQTLQLTILQKQKLFDYLEWNALPENQTYRYDYYHNNCATKIRDVLAQQLGSDLKWDSTFLKPQHSFREKTNDYLSPLPWGDLGIDICLGLPIDKKMTAYEYMFLPDYIESFVEHAFIQSDSAITSLVAEKTVVFEPTPSASSVNFIHPWIAFGILFLIVAAISFYDWQRKKISKWLDLLLFAVSGLIGILLLFLWAFTDHHDAARNFNLLWAFPLHLIGAMMLLQKNPGRRTLQYFTFVEILTGVLIGFWAIWPQQLNPFLLPVAFSILVRAIVICRNLKLATDGTD
jgi:hypothetical protein